MSEAEHKAIVRDIRNRLSLCKPQADSRGKVNGASGAPEPRPKNFLEIVKAIAPSVTAFDRDFCSLCFALATGVGKTRLMGAFISYLHEAHGMRNFVVIAPNLTIYEKLITDFKPGTPKYVFNGIQAFATTKPIVVTMVFNGFKKCLYEKQKFDSNPERMFAKIIEDEKDALKWFRPDLSRFSIRRNNGENYFPDFVVETNDMKYICEVKADSKVNDPDVIDKWNAAVAWCEVVSEAERAAGRKTTEYRDLTPRNLSKSIGIKTVKLQRGYGHPGQPPEQMRFGVVSVGLLDADDRECDPYNIPDGFIATTIAIHLGKRIA
jgi:hypothetical protein